MPSDPLSTWDDNPPVVLGTHVLLELIDEHGARERYEFDMTPDSASDFDAGLLGLGTPLAFPGSVFGVVLALTQHEVAALDGRVRTAFTMLVVGLLALLAAPWQGGMQWPRDAVGWSGLAALTVLYGTAFTVMFTLLPRLGVVGNSPILNVEPVAALVLGWWILGQSVTAIQWAGALLVVGTVMGLGLRRR